MDYTNDNTGAGISDKDLAERYKDFLEKVRDILFARRYSASSNFTNSNFENLKTIGTFGNGPFSLTANRDNTGNVYKAWDLREFSALDQNNFGDPVESMFFHSCSKTPTKKMSKCEGPNQFT